MRARGYDLGIRDGDAIPSGEAIVDVLRLLEDGAVRAVLYKRMSGWS